MPRAPNCNASTICFFSTAAVSRMMRTPPEAVPLRALRSRSASRPVWCGMARSSRRMSGLISVASFTASRPSQASPTTFISFSDSSRRRSPSRKMGWSSAITIRMELTRLSMTALSGRWNPNLQPSAVSRIRFYREFARKQANPFPDHSRSLSRGIQFSLRHCSRKRETPPIVLHRQLQFVRSLSQAHQHVARAGVLAHIHQALLHDASQFPAYLLRQFDALELADELRGNPRLTPEPLHHIGNKAQKPVGVHLERLHLLHQFTQLQHFFAEQFLDAPQFRIHDRRLCPRLTPQHIDLHFHGNQRLNRAVMQLARKTRAFHRSRPLPQPPHQVDVINRRPHLLREFLQKAQFLFGRTHQLRIEQEYPARPLFSKREGYRRQRLKGFHLSQCIQELLIDVTQPVSAPIQ